jgi:hypothetical protein
LRVIDAEFNGTKYRIALDEMALEVNDHSAAEPCSTSVKENILELESVTPQFETKVTLLEVLQSAGVEIDNQFAESKTKQISDKDLIADRTIDQSKPAEYKQGRGSNAGMVSRNGVSSGPRSNEDTISIAERITSDSSPEMDQ